MPLLHSHYLLGLDPGAFFACFLGEEDGLSTAQDREFDKNRWRLLKGLVRDWEDLEI